MSFKRRPTNDHPQHDAILDLWVEGVPTMEIADLTGVGFNVVAYQVDIARCAEDPRALRREVRNAAVLRWRNAQRVGNIGAAALPADPRPPAETYALSRECGIEPVARVVANRGALGSTGPASVEISVARVRFLEGSPA